jgi:hypothetical protein
LLLKLDLDAIALVAAKDEGLNPLILQPVHHCARVVPFHVARLFILRFFRAHLVDILRQHVHIAGIKIEPHIQRDLDVDRPAHTSRPPGTFADCTS